MKVLVGLPIVTYIMYVAALSLRGILYFQTTSPSRNVLFVTNTCIVVITLFGQELIIANV